MLINVSVFKCYNYTQKLVLGDVIISFISLSKLDAVTLRNYGIMFYFLYLVVGCQLIKESFPVLNIIIDSVVT